MTSNPRDVTRIKGFITYLQLVMKSIERGNYNPELVDRVNNHIVDFYDQVRNDNLSLIKKNSIVTKEDEVILDDEQIEDLKNIQKQLKITEKPELQLKNLCINTNCSAEMTDDFSEKCLLCDGFYSDDGLNDVLFIEEEPNNRSAECSLISFK